jgi:dihydrolipoamide dehydrogenase
MAEKRFDLIVIGAGPGGYVAAIRAAQLGMSVACVEKQYLGGTCLNVGCIPSKAMLDSSEKVYALKHSMAAHGIRVGEVSVDLAKMLKRKEEVVRALTNGVGFLFRKNKVEHIAGTARITAPGSVHVDAKDGPRQLSAARILVATGSAPIELPALPFDGVHIISSTEALALKQVPQKLVVVGAGYIGIELGSVWSRLGSEVLILEFTDRALPGMDRELAGQLQKLLERQGLKFRFNTVAESAEVADGKVKLAWASGPQRGSEEADRVLVAVGRRPLTEGLGLEQLGVELDDRGFVRVGGDFQTTIEGIYAIGDVIGGLMLAHKAEEEGVAAVELMHGGAGHVNYSACPGVVYCHPELAQVGLSEEDAARRGPVKVGRFPLLANGRARSMGETDGLVKVVADARTDRILGVHILAARASDMIAEAALAMEFAASAEDLGRSFHAHPTFPEALKEAALAADRRAIHV